MEKLYFVEIFGIIGSIATIIQLIIVFKKKKSKPRKPAKKGFGCDLTRGRYYVNSKNYNNN